MKKLLFLFSLLWSVVYSQTTPVAQFATITQLKAYNGTAAAIVVTDSATQGYFRLCPNCTVDESNTYAGVGGKKWSRLKDAKIVQLINSKAESADLSNKADLVNGLIPTSQIPALAVTDFLGSPASESEMLALDGQRGDWCIRTDVNRTYFVVAEPSSVLANWRYIETPASPVTSVNGQTGVIVLAPADIGLPNINNTSDLNKPISNATQSALDQKLNKSDTGSLSDRINSKLDSIPGKVLSSNDYTDSEKAKLAGLSNFDSTGIAYRGKNNGFSTDQNFAGKINLATGTTLANGIQFGDIGMYRVSSTQLFLGATLNIGGNALFGAGLNNWSSSNNAKIESTANGTIISRNIADANTALTVNQINTSSTGKIFDAQHVGVSKVSIDTTGNLSVAAQIRLATGTTSANGILFGDIPIYRLSSTQLGTAGASWNLAGGYVYTNNGLANSSGGVNTGLIVPGSSGINMTTNVANANTVVTINGIHPSMTGKLLDVQHAGASRVSIDTTGNVTATGYGIFTRTNTDSAYYQDNAAIKGSHTGAFQAGAIPSGVLGYVKLTGNNDPRGGHGVGVFGQVEDSIGNKDYPIGVEGRVDGTSTDNHPQYGGHFLASWKGSGDFDATYYSRLNYGVSGRAEIYNANGTPQYEGINVNYYAPYPVGGALSYSVIAEAPAWFQGGIGIGDANNIAPSALLDIKSTNKGVLFPRVTSTQRGAISSPDKGLTVYDSTINRYTTFNGSTWDTLKVYADSSTSMTAFFASGTFTMPANAKFIDVGLFGAGGGGGGGRKGLAASGVSGGGGASAGAYTFKRFKASDVSSTLMINVGTGGNGGASQASNSTNGNNGSAGGTSSIVDASSHILAKANGGGAGGGGSTSTGSAGSASSGEFPGGAGATSNVTGQPSQAVSTVNSSGGGGGGGGVSTGSAAFAGGIGATRPQSVDQIGAGTSGAVNNAGGAGGNGWVSYEPAAGGGGGGGSTTTNGGTGGGGGFPGGGGGGGGAALDGVGNSGAGGPGANGIVVIWVYY